MSKLLILAGVLVGSAAGLGLMNTSSGTPSKQAAFEAVDAATIMQVSKDATPQVETIVLGSGCFWGAEKGYEAIPGVLNAVSGYADGKVKPTYREITKYKHKHNPNNHAEVVQVTFNRSVVSLEAILQHYFESHDPTQLNRQGNDIGTQYRSTILTSSAAQQALAEQLSAEYQVLLTHAGYGQITTQIKPLERFYPAEAYHQDYLAKNPNGYCPDHSTGVKFAKSETRLAQSDTKIDNAALMKGKQIVVIEADGYCPYCEKLSADVLNHYQGAIPVSFRTARQLDGLTVNSPTWATPTLLFMENGSEVFARQGYQSPEEFYRVLGAFKLGNTEAYHVAFNEGTDGRFCKQYEMFKNTPDGIFIDTLSGAPLFDTRDRFNSGTGWLSFTKAVDGSVTEHRDLSYGMVRTEIRSASSGIHLGHVFNDGPDGLPRYCINATVLEFQPR